MGRKVTDKDGNEFDIETLVQSMIGKSGGDSNKAVELLLTENLELRGKNRDLRTQVEDFKIKVPGADAVVLTAEDVALFNAYKELGKPEDIKTIATKAEEMTSKLSKIERETLISSAAEAHGYKKSVLSNLVDANALNLEMGQLEETGKDGNKVMKPAAFIKDDSGNKKLLSDVIKERFDDFTPALVNPAQGATANGTSWPSQVPQGSPPPTESLAGAYLKQTYVQVQDGKQ